MRTIRTPRSTPVRHLARGGAALTAALALVLAGCGTEEAEPGDGGDEPAPTATEAPPAQDPSTEPDDEPTEPTEPEDTTPPDDVTTAPGEDPSETEAPPAAETPGEGETVNPQDAAQLPEVQAAITDAAERAGIDAAEITVVSYGGVTWRDGSIGCPQPGMAYTMALVPGSRLVLDVGGEEQAYHAGNQQPLTYCADPQDPAPGESSSTS